MARLCQVLSADERDRAARFHFDRDRRRFMAGRGLLRLILARYLDRPPGSLRLSYGPRGKPALAESRGTPPLRFNVSHAAGLALYAVGRDRELGVDVERIAPELEAGIAERFFSPREVAALARVPPDRRSESFFACWTRKEAYVKAKGDGLALGLDQFDVSLAPGEPAALLHVDGDPGETVRWSLLALDPGTGYAAALAVEGAGWRLSCLDWPPCCSGPETPVGGAG
jgi:4'-phosphopantetheinyl transferase